MISGTGVAILAVEDDDGDFLIARKLLEKAQTAGMKLERAVSLSDGIKAAKEGRFDVVLLDLSLPDSVGSETFERLRARVPDLPVVVLTGLEDEHVATSAIQHGAQDYLVKGKLDSDRLARAIRHAIERHRSDETVRRYREHLEHLVSVRTAELRKANELLRRELAEHEKLKQENEELQAELLESRKLESTGRLAVGIAHELNNALTVVRGYGEIMLTDLDDRAALRRDAQEIVAASEATALMVRQLLAFGRKQVLEPRIMDANVLVQNSLTMLKPLLGESVELKVVPAEGRACIRADTGQVEQVMAHIAVNAHDAMPDGGRFTVRVEHVIAGGGRNDEVARGRFVRLAFEDNGSGMSRDTLARVFDPFFSTKQGRGMGLAVTYGVMKQHGGWAEARSEEGDGSTFLLYFPWVPPPDGAMEPDGDIAAAPKGRGERILLVEDEDSVRRYLGRLLEHAGYTVVQADGLAGACRQGAAGAWRFAMVFSDVVLPDGTGLEVADAVLGHAPDVKVLLSSGYLDEKAMGEQILRRGLSFLPKPYSGHDLLSKVREILDRPA